MVINCSRQVIHHLPAVFIRLSAPYTRDTAARSRFRP